MATQPGDCRLQAEIEVLEGLTRHLLVGGHTCVLLPLQPGARTGLGVQTGAVGLRACTSPWVQKVRHLARRADRAGPLFESNWL